MREVVDRLRLARGGASYTTVRTRLEQLGLDVPTRPDSDATISPWRRRFSEHELEDAVGASRSLNEVFRRLGLRVGGSQWITVRSLILERGWSTEHWRRPLSGGSGTSEADRFEAALAAADLAAVVRRASSRADVIRALGFTPSSSRYRALAAAIGRHELSTSHFEKATAAMRRTRRRPRPLDVVLVAGARNTNTHNLKQRLIADGVFDARCTTCGLTEWLGGPIPLELDHIDGDRTNNLLANLRVLCPNCHALTGTYRGRNIGRVGGRDSSDGRG